MAERRMFAKTIIDSDAFLDMPLSTQALYFHLSMRADDDGFINNPKKIQRMVGASEDDLKLLIAKNFIIPFDTGIVVIKHWKIHNYIRSDRYKETVYAEEKERLELKENGAYTIGIPDGDDMTTVGIPNGDKRETQVRVGQGSLVEDNIGDGKKEAGKPPRPRFSPPGVDDVAAYCNENGYAVDPQRFVNYYTSNGWMVGRNKMKDWKAAVRTWAAKDKQPQTQGSYRKQTKAEELDEFYKMAQEWSESG